MKPKVAFTCNGCLFSLFGRMRSDKYDGIHIAINTWEKTEAEKLGCRVVACFEEQYHSLPPAEIPPDFLRDNFYADRFLRPLPLARRHEALAKMISFWRAIFDQHKPLACFHDTISLEVEEVISKVCREKNILDLTCVGIPVPGYLFWKPDPYSTTLPHDLLRAARPTNEQYQHAKKIVLEIREKKFTQPYYSYFDPNFAHIGKGLLLERLGAYLLLKFATRFRIPLLTRALRAYCSRRGFDLPHLQKHLSFELLVFYNNHGYLPKPHYLDELYDEWCRRTNTYNRPEEFAPYRKLVYPLHYEPEATTLYYAPHCADQPALIGRIARNLPLDTVLIVKEHPSQPGRLLTREFLTARKNHPNVFYLPGRVTNYELLEMCDAVITATGTLGWEALCSGKPVIVMGDVYYDKHPQVVKMPVPEDIRHVLSRPLPQPEFEDSVDYLARLLALSFPGEFNVHNLSEENISNMTRALENVVTNRAIHPFAQYPR